MVSHIDKGVSTRIGAGSSEMDYVSINVKPYCLEAINNSIERIGETVNVGVS